MGMRPQSDRTKGLILQMRREGKSLREIGAWFGLTQEGIRQILKGIGGPSVKFVSKVRKANKVHRHENGCITVNSTNPLSWLRDNPQIGIKPPQPYSFRTCKTKDCVREEHILSGDDKYRHILNKRSREDQNGCRVWLGPTHPSGYGRISVDRKPSYTHRLAWELDRGKIPKGKVIDHLCDNKMCCNVNHLSVTDIASNIRRGIRIRDRAPITDEEIDRWVSMFSSGHTIESIMRERGRHRVTYISATSAFLNNGSNCKSWGDQTKGRIRRYFEERPELMP